MIEELATAFHEASHVVVGSVFGASCLSLSIVPQGKTAGRAHLSFRGGPIQQAVVAAAGIAGVNRFLNRDGTKFYAESLNDQATAIEEFYRLGWNQAKAVETYRDCCALAKQIVNEKWHAITAVAESLVLLKELGGGTVRALIAGADRKAAPRAFPRQRPISESLGFELGSPTTIRDDARTVEVVWFTGSDVMRLDPSTDQGYTLHFDPMGADLSRLNNKAAVLDSHNSGDIFRQLGVVDRAWQRDGKYFATLRFSRRPALRGLWQDVKDGILSKFSMGVELLETIDTLGKNGKLEMRTATKWRPYEISLLYVPADFGTTTLRAVPAQAKAVAPWLAAQSRQRQIDALRLA